jgi:hypothetical protein
MNESKSILVENTWLRSEDCEYLIVLYETFWSPDVGTDFNGDRGLYYTVFSGSTEVKQYLRALSKRLQDRIQEFFGVTGLFLEALFLAALLKGAFHKRHADNEKYVGGKWIPNHVPQRDYTALVYLNSDFGGGDLRFPQHNVCIRPQRGLLVAFPSNGAFVHRVTRVNRGTRYSMPVWFTKDKRFASTLLSEP